jgi:hypothetical protein
MARGREDTFFRAKDTRRRTLELLLLLLSFGRTKNDGEEAAGIALLSSLCAMDTAPSFVVTTTTPSQERETTY